MLIGKPHGKTGLKMKEKMKEQEIQTLTQEANQIQTEAEKILPPQWTEGQIAHLQINLNIEDVEHELESYRQILQPAKDEAIAVFLSKLNNHFGTPENNSDTIDDYFICVQDLPEYYLEKTYRNILNKCKWYPRVSEIRMAIPDKFWKQTITFRKIKAIHKKLKEIKNEPSSK